MLYGIVADACQQWCFKIAAQQGKDQMTTMRKTYLFAWFGKLMLSINRNMYKTSQNKAFLRVLAENDSQIFLTSFKWNFSTIFQ